jgi:hypothetical protein
MKGVGESNYGRYVASRTPNNKKTAISEFCDWRNVGILLEPTIEAKNRLIDAEGQGLRSASATMIDGAIVTLFAECYLLSVNTTQAENNREERTHRPERAQSDTAR